MDKKDGWTMGRNIRRAWPEKVIEALEDDGTGKAGRWMTFKAIRMRLVALGYPEPHDRIKIVLHTLVKRGHVERAKRPLAIRGNPNTSGKEYIYRRTVKPFKAQVQGQGIKNSTVEKIQRGFQLKLDHPRLPDWYRAMMIYW